MKRILFFFVFLILLLFPCVAEEENRPLVTVMDFSLSGISNAEGRLLVDFISSGVRETARYRIIDRAQRDSILEEQEFSLSGCTDERCQLEVGKLLSANLMFVGSLGRIGDRYILNMKLVDVATGETIGTASEKYSDLNALVDDSSRLVLGMLGTEGKVPGPSRTGSPASAVTMEPAEARIPDSKFILFTPKRFLQPAYYSFEYNDYRFRYFRGFTGIVDAIMEEQPGIGGDYRLMLEDYGKSVKRNCFLEIAGMSLGVVGYGVMIFGAELTSEKVVLAGLGTFLGGITMNIIGRVLMGKPPDDIVNHYNLHYAGN